MLPLRMADQLAWLESCESCQVLWVEKLDEAVIARLEKRLSLTRVIGALAAEDRRTLAHEIAGETADDARQLRVLEAIRKVLSALAGLAGF